MTTQIVGVMKWPELGREQMAELYKEINLKKVA